MVPRPPRDGRAAKAVLVGVALLAPLTLSIGRTHAPLVAPQLTPLVAQGTAPDFGKDVAPVLYKNCASCHRPGGIGPFSMLDADTVKAYAKDIRDAVSTGYMPPWHADGPRGVFSNDRRLADLDRQAILRWIDDGAKVGNKRALPPTPVFDSQWEIGTPDAVFTMNEPFTVPASGTVEYQYFEIPTNFTEDKWVQAIEIMPGSREVVHHVLVYARAPQAPPPAGAAAPGAASPGSGAPAAARPAAKPAVEFDANNEFTDPPRKDPRNAPPMRVGNLIGTTAPGTNVVRFPEGTALRVRAGTTLVFQMHYTAHGHERQDRTSVGFQFAKAAPQEQVIASNFLNGKFTLPAGQKDVMVPSTITINEPVKIYGLFPHTHLRGTRWQYTLEKPDGTSEIILDVPRYDFNWQTYYMFAKPLEIPAGAKITSKAWYDNSAANPHNPDPKVDVRWGDQTWEEMQYTGFLYSVNSRRLRP
ncbi:MAG: cytochrome c [Gemmatimonadaceae bacterium]|nr:cytochrome c [Gemmatimonadaceae bacterium]